MRLKRLLPVSFVAGALGALTLAAPAVANTDVASCQITGTASTSDSTHPGEGLQLSGGSGTYTFAAGTVPLQLECVAVDDTHSVTFSSGTLTVSADHEVARATVSGGLCRYLHQHGLRNRQCDERHREHQCDEYHRYRVA